MLTFIGGSPSIILEGVIKIVQTLSFLAFESFDTIRANNVAALREIWRPLPENQGRIVFSAHLEPDLIELLIQTKVPTIVCIDDFSHLVRSFILESIGVSDSIALATASYTRFSEFTPDANKLTLNSDIYAEKTISIARRITTFLGISLTEAQWGRVESEINQQKKEDINFRDYVAREFPSSFVQLSQESLHKYSLLSKEYRLIIEATEKWYSNIARGEQFEGGYLERSLFRSGDTPDRNLMGSILLVGPARTLFFGPFFYLPSGRWIANVEFEVFGCDKETLILADAFNGELLDVVSLRLPQRGSYTFQLKFENFSSSGPMQIRMQMLKGAIDGEFLLHGVEIRRQLAPLSVI